MLIELLWAVVNIKPRIKAAKAYNRKFAQIREKNELDKLEFESNEKKDTSYTSKG